MMTIFSIPRYVPAFLSVISIITSLNLTAGEALESNETEKVVQKNKTVSNDIMELDKITITETPFDMALKRQPINSIIVNREGA